MSDTPETDQQSIAVHGTRLSPGVRYVGSDFARKLERERNEWRQKTKEALKDYLQAGRERDEWKAKFIQQNKDLGCELRDPNGTIWDHAASLEHERDELIHAARALRDAKGRYHTQQAAERLFKLIP